MKINNYHTSSTRKNISAVLSTETIIKSLSINEIDRDLIYTVFDRLNANRQIIYSFSESLLSNRIEI